MKLSTRVEPLSLAATLTRHGVPLSESVSTALAWSRGSPVNEDRNLPLPFLLVAGDLVVLKTLSPFQVPDAISNSQHRPGPYSSCFVSVTPTKRARYEPTGTIFFTQILIELSFQKCAGAACCDVAAVGEGS